MPYLEYGWSVTDCKAPCGQPWLFAPKKSWHTFTPTEFVGGLRVDRNWLVHSKNRAIHFSYIEIQSEMFMGDRNGLMLYKNRVMIYVHGNSIGNFHVDRNGLMLCKTRGILARIQLYTSSPVHLVHLGRRAG